MNVNANPMDKKLHESVLQYLETVRRELGEDEWKNAVKKQVLQACQMGGAYEDFWRAQIKTPGYEWIDIDAMKAQAASMPPGTGGAMDVNQLLAQTFKKRMPGMKTQAQFTAFRATFEAFEAVCNSIFNVNAEKEAESRKILDQAFLACKQATDISIKLEAVPEAATSKAAEEFKKAPDEFQEFDVQQALLGELGRVVSLDDLKVWYAETKVRRDSVKSQSLRDILIDAIRNRKMALTPAS